MNRVSKFLASLLVAFVFLFVSVKISFAQVVINEISPASTPEWVELYNGGSASVALDGCTLNMGSDSQIINLTAADSVSADGYKIFTWSSNWLNNTGDTVTLTCPTFSDGPITYSYSFTSDKSYGRSPNGSGSFTVLSTVTYESQNVNPTPTPTASPTPSPTSTSTSTPTPTPTATPTKSPTPKPSSTKSPTPKPSPTEEATPTPYEEVLQTTPPELLGLSTESPTPGTMVEGNKTFNFPLIAVLFVVSGLLCVGVPIVWSIRRKFKYNDPTSENT